MNALLETLLLGALGVLCELGEAVHWSIEHVLSQLDEVRRRRPS